MDTLPDRWTLTGNGILWNVAGAARLPHHDHVEMSGRKLSVIVRYGVDENRRLSLTREIIWPTLRTKPKNVRAYLRRTYGDDVAPRFLDGEEALPGPVAQVHFDGLLTIAHEPVNGLVVTRTIFPLTDKSAVIEQWRVANIGAVPVPLEVSFPAIDETDSGVYGEYRLEAGLWGTDACWLNGGASATVSLLFSARRADEPPFSLDPNAEEKARRDLIENIRLPFAAWLRTPDPVLNAAFGFAKLRARESIFDTAMGLVHSPGGGRFYGGVWANDQAEYSGPFFPLLGDEVAQEAALNAYRIFARAMTPNYAPLPSSFEVEGDVAWSGAGDRGDAAMVASGAARFALTTGDRAVAAELYPAVAWCLEYCRRKTNAAGVIASDSDELENRFPSGDANLCTSCLAYNGLRRGADLARALDKPNEAADYDARADVLAQAIERHFGATVEGFATYRYYEGNTKLRAWICLPLTVGLTGRTEGTVAALFSPQLWTADGLATESGSAVFWDRSTLYALRGVFAAGQPDVAWHYLSAYLRRRLLGEHVPYAVEAHPAGGQAHLSAESALLCRIVTEGMLGIVPTGLRSFRLTVNVPAALRFIDFHFTSFGRRLTIKVRNFGDEVLVQVLGYFSQIGPNGATYTIMLPE